VIRRAAVQQTATGETVNYTYDALNRLATAGATNGNPAGGSLTLWGIWCG
jgi:RHS Repeat